MTIQQLIKKIRKSYPQHNVLIGTGRGSKVHLYLLKCEDGEVVETLASYELRERGDTANADLMDLILYKVTSED